jgi:glyoxylase-like metal-dependent hydrolase (beta-lactamase superfamily II)
MVIHPLSTGFGLSFLLESARGLVMIDSGSPGQQHVVVRKMKAIGRSDLKLIWITHAHFDHYGSAHALRALTGAKIGVHPADAESMSAGLSPLGSWRGRGSFLRYAQPVLGRFYPLTRTQPDFMLDDGASLEPYGLKASILHTPGHTPGHTCVLLEDGTAFAADLVARNPRPRLQDLLATDWSQLPTSLERLQAAKPQRIYTGHARAPMSGAALQMIRAR